MIFCLFGLATLSYRYCTFQYDTYMNIYMNEYIFGKSHVTMYEKSLLYQILDQSNLRYNKEWKQNRISDLQRQAVSHC